jgi:hypothetical protein
MIINQLAKKKHQNPLAPFCYCGGRIAVNIFPLFIESSKKKKFLSPIIWFMVQLCNSFNPIGLGSLRCPRCDVVWFTCECASNSSLHNFILNYHDVIWHPGTRGNFRHTLNESMSRNLLFTLKCSGTWGNWNTRKLCNVEHFWWRCFIEHIFRLQFLNRASDGTTTKKNWCWWNS